jgi:hypothetical protein
MLAFHGDFLNLRTTSLGLQRTYNRIDFGYTGLGRIVQQTATE